MTSWLTVYRRPFIQGGGGGGQQSERGHPDFPPSQLALFILHFPYVDEGKADHTANSNITKMKPTSAEIADEFST